ncbi:MAG: hypothetical protein JW867_09115 [Candidatus Omnitrophica bacterium]|nr:hypothetical protein [Candidatus Omnitrophota bacterium]
MDERQKAIVVHASFGQGHKKAAQAAGEALDAAVYDILDFTHPLIKKLYVFSYLFVTHHTPLIWKIVFNTSKNRIFAFILHKLQFCFFSPFISLLRKEKPGVVIFTHFSPPRFAVSVKKELNCKFVTIVTDMRVHPLWVQDYIDYYFASLPATRQDLIQQGVDPVKIISGFAALRNGFLKELSTDMLFDKFSLPKRDTILFVSSSRGSFPFLIKTVKKLIERFNLIVIYGKNNKLKDYLQNLESANIRFFSFYEQIWELISLSSVIVAKPGGLTVFEGVYKKKNFVFTHFIPGQEEENMRILIEKNVARFARSKDELLEAIIYFIDSNSLKDEDYPLVLKDIRQPLKDLISKISS